MILEIVKYGHPALRQAGARVEAVTPDVQRLVDDMLETMHAARGVGLAAQQVGHSLQVMVVDVREAKDRPSTMERDGVTVEVGAYMPMVLINPEVAPAGPAEKGPEGCLSFPELYAEVVRPSRLEVSALDREGTRQTFRCGGLLARAIQHELDHLRGVLFIDRMSAGQKEELRPELDRLQSATKAELKRRAPALR